MDTGQQIPRWFRLTGDIHVEIVDKFSGGNVHPDRVMAQWVLVLMISGTRTFRINGEDQVVHGGEYILLPPHVRHCGLRYDEHEAYFAHFQAEGAEIPPPSELDSGHILLPPDGVRGLPPGPTLFQRKFSLLPNPGDLVPTQLGHAKKEAVVQAGKQDGPPDSAIH